MDTAFRIHHQHSSPPSDLSHGSVRDSQPWTDAPHFLHDILHPNSQIPGALFDDPSTAAETHRVAASAIIHSLPVVRSPTQLRRRPHLNATALLPLRTHSHSFSGIPKSPSVPAFRTKVDLDDRPSTSHSSTGPPSLSLSRTQSNPATNRSPSRRKPPASHSSYGIETTCGPPPSYSTQRTLSQDRLRKPEPGPRFTTKIDLEVHQVLRTEQDPSGEAIGTATDPVTADVVSSPETIDTQSVITPNTEEYSEDATAMSMAAYGVHIHEDDQSQDKVQTIPRNGLSAGEEESKGSSSDERKSEDLFLNIAKTDGNKGEKRRSRISLPFFSSARSNIQKLPSPSTQVDPALLSPAAELPNYYSKRSSLGQHHTTAASEHPQETPRPRTQGGGRAASLATRSVVGRSLDQTNEPFRVHGRRYSNAGTDAGFRANMRSSIPARSNRMVAESAALPGYAGHNAATESTISTTAPSTVWDELDDLKSRIRKLELTGKLPSSSAAAMSSAERPRTATTAATTLSSSPKTNKPNISTMQSAIEGIPTTVHPLLHEALSQAKPLLNNDVYQKLQATASDALQLVAMMNGDAQAGANSSFGMSSASERQIRRRAESMCRGLTELTIALSAEPKAAASPTYRPASRDTSSALHSSFVSMRLNNEASDLPPVTSRVHSRLETRRTSQQFGANKAGYSSPVTTVHTPNSQQPTQTATSSGPGRTSTLIRHRRAQGYLDGATEDESSVSPSIRPVSRAMTEVGGGYLRHSPRDRVVNVSREYTSQHPMPTQYEGLASEQQQMRSPLPAGLGSNFLQRRKYTKPTSGVGMQDSSPVTPRERESFGRVSVVPRGDAAEDNTTTPENVTVTRGSGGSSRRSLGLASRIGSSVGSRLRAVRAERLKERAQGQGDVPPSPQQQQQQQQPLQPLQPLEPGEESAKSDGEGVRSGMASE